MANILDKAFKYVPSAQTDIRKTFARVRRELARREPERFKPLLPAQDEVRKSEIASELETRRAKRRAA